MPFTPHPPVWSTFEVDDNFGRWTATMHAPPALAGVVDGLWHFRGRVAHAHERVFPHGAVEIIVHLGERYRGHERDGLQHYPALCLSGLRLQPLVIEAPPAACTVLGLRLKPAAAWTVLGGAAGEAQDRTVDLADVLGAAARELGEACNDAPDTRTCLRRAAAWVAQRLRQGRPADAAVVWMAQAIAAHRGAVSIEALRERTGWSRSRMAAVFQAQVGLSPKRYARLQRFRHALEHLQHPGAVLADVAGACGYADQSHMTAEFDEMAGTTPGALLAALRYPHSPNLAEGERR
jgi:AraC-like DNA-binding protein